jgi:hypothetical protein
VIGSGALVGAVVGAWEGVAVETILAVLVMIAGVLLSKGVDPGDGWQEVMKMNKIAREKYFCLIETSTAHRK